MVNLSASCFKLIVEIQLWSTHGVSENVDVLSLLRNYVWCGNTKIITKIALGDERRREVLKTSQGDA